MEGEPQQLRVAGGGGRGRARGVSGAGQQEVAVSGGGVEVPRPLSFYLQAGRRRGGLGALEQFQLGRSTGLREVSQCSVQGPMGRLVNKNPVNFADKFPKALSTQRGH